MRLAKSTKRSRAISNKRKKAEMLLLPIGHGSYIATGKLIAILNSDSSPVRRMVQEAKKAKTLKDATHGRHCRSVLVMDNGDIVLSALNPDTMAQRLDKSSDLNMRTDVYRKRP